MFYGEIRRPKPLYWPGWYILRLENEEDSRTASRLFTNAGMNDVLSEYIASVGYMEIPRIKRTPVSDLDSVLIPQDSRRDPFLSKIQQLFRYSAFSFIYLPAHRGLAVYKKVLNRSEEISSKMIVFLDVKRWKAFFSITLSILGMILVCLSFPPSRSVLITASLPWLMFIIAERGTVGVPAILIFYVVSNLFRTKKFQMSAAVVGLLAGATGVFFAFPTLYAALTLTASVLILIIGKENHLYLKSIFKKSKISELRSLDHKIFQPISLTNASSEKPKKTSSPLQIFPALAGLGFLLPLLVLPFQKNAIIPTPSPLQEKTSYTNISALHNLFDSSKQDSLPNVSNLLASIAYQEGLLYGAKYNLPTLDDTLSLKNYKEKNGILFPEEQILTRYNQHWFQSILERELNIGVGKLYSTLEGPTPIRMVRTPSIAPFLKGKELKILIYIGIAIVFILGTRGTVFWNPPSSLYRLSSSSKRKRRRAA